MSKWTKPYGVHDKLLLILSEHSMASDWVGTEIASARGREARGKKQMLFPITITPIRKVEDGSCLTPIGEGFGEGSSGVPHSGLQWVGARPQAYQREFEKLVAALKAEAVE